MGFMAVGQKVKLNKAKDQRQIAKVKNNQKHIAFQVSLFQEGLREAY